MKIKSYNNVKEVELSTPCLTSSDMIDMSEEMEVDIMKLLDIASADADRLMNITTLPRISSDVSSASLLSRSKLLVNKGSNIYFMDENGEQYEWVFETVMVDGEKKKKRKKKRKKVKRKLMFTSESVCSHSHQENCDNPRDKLHNSKFSGGSFFRKSNSYLYQPKSHSNFSSEIKESNKLINKFDKNFLDDNFVTSNSIRKKKKKSEKLDTIEEVYDSNSSCEEKKFNRNNKENVGNKKLERKNDSEQKSTNLKMNLMKVMYDDEGDVIHGYAHGLVEDSQWEEKVGFN
jgi:hypothetical protein